jgi:hypothetical protein
MTIMHWIPKEALALGTGWFTWPRHERVSDRYGTISLFNTCHAHDRPFDKPFDKPIPLAHDDLVVGTEGVLLVEIIETMDSTHIGDIMRGLYPSTPNVGDIFVLGPGRVFYDKEGPDVAIGLLPDDDRKSDWLDPGTLYRCHDQRVILHFMESSD